MFTCSFSNLHSYVRMSYIHTYVHGAYMVNLFVFTGPSPLVVILNIMKNIDTSSIVIQWDAVDDFLNTTYTVTWTDEEDAMQVATLIEQTSYTITGLTLDTVYTITVTAANMCGDGPKVMNSILISTDTTSNVTASTNPMDVVSSVNSTAATCKFYILLLFLLLCY